VRPAGGAGRTLDPSRCSAANVRKWVERGNKPVLADQHRKRSADAQRSSSPPVFDRDTKNTSDRSLIE
jgi:hypothetical protein